MPVAAASKEDRLTSFKNKGKDAEVMYSTKAEFTLKASFLDRPRVKSAFQDSNQLVKDVHEALLSYESNGTLEQVIWSLQKADFS